MAIKESIDTPARDPVRHCIEGTGVVLMREGAGLI